MKKYLVMDFGQVMARYNPKEMTANFITDKEDGKLITDVLFDRLYWDRLDAGTIEDEELLSLVHERLPMRLWESADKIYNTWIYSLPEIPGMRELVLEMKEKYSLSLCLLSNISRGFAEHESEIPILKIFDKKIYSAVCGYTKPSAEIFEHLCKVCEISPDEAVFVDDSEKNIKGAERFGIKSVLFKDDVKELRKKLIEIFEQ